MTVTEKASYLKGLADGLGLDETVKQDKILKSVIDLLTDLALSVDDLDAEIAEMAEQVDEIDEDLANLEEDVYDDGCDCDDDYCCDCDCDEDGDYCIKCPECSGEICISEDDIYSDDPIVCPECGAEIELEVIDDEDEDEEAKD